MASVVYPRTVDKMCDISCILQKGASRELPAFVDKYVSAETAELFLKAIYLVLVNPKISEKR